MHNIWTLMVFDPNEPQAIVLQYKSRNGAVKARDDVVKMEVPLTIWDDYGRELTLGMNLGRKMLLQDVERASEGNTILSVKNNLSQAEAQIRTQAAMQSDKRIQGATAAANLTNPAFRQ